MINLGAHAVFIVWGYAGVAAVTLALIAWVVADGRSVAARLRRLEEQGIRRRSGGPGA